MGSETHRELIVRRTLDFIKWLADDKYGLEEELVLPCGVSEYLGRYIAELEQYRAKYFALLEQVGHRPPPPDQEGR
ncbi:MAG: hypothetical protein K2X87_19250 [Gemmataceae bacterium]|nr:hypothetical protein [Gemmataceae bacterium]